MNEIKMLIKEMTKEEKIEAVGAMLAWSGLLFMGFIISVICG